MELKRGNHVGIFIVLPFTFSKNLKLRHFTSQLSTDNKDIYRKVRKELFRTLGVRSFGIIKIRIQVHLVHGASNEPLHPIRTRETLGRPHYTAVLCILWGARNEANRHEDTSNIKTRKRDKVDLPCSEFIKI